MRKGNNWQAAMETGGPARFKIQDQTIAHAKEGGMNKQKTI
jgi:hypothetical protein